MNHRTNLVAAASLALLGWGVSWNSSHPTVGCDPESVRITEGDALFYCYVAQ
jgi:hypothetical protein